MSGPLVDGGVEMLQFFSQSRTKGFLWWYFSFRIVVFVGKAVASVGIFNDDVCGGLW